MSTTSTAPVRNVVPADQVRQLGPMPRWLRLLCAALLGVTSPLWMSLLAIAGLGFIAWVLGRAVLTKTL